MAVGSVCQTPGALFHSSIQPRSISISVDLPIALVLSEGEAELLDANLHNALELVLARYF